ncbi:MAG: hypothetical protein M1820_004690 [Bogoriella megaspora]|nr:MAG: hypothetical protein M1820_004690 [Bogoriella megaspora]
MASASASEDPWLQARNEYMKDLSEEERKLFEAASSENLLPENLLDSTIAAQQSHKEQSGSRAISRKLEPFVNAISQYGDALDVFSNTLLGVLWKSTWKGFSIEFEGSILPSFRRNLENMERAVVASHMTESRRYRELQRTEKEETERQRKACTNTPQSTIEAFFYPRYLLVLTLRSILKSGERGFLEPASGYFKTKTFESGETRNSQIVFGTMGSNLPGANMARYRSSIIDQLSKDFGKEDLTIQELTGEDIIKRNITSHDTAVVYFYCDFSDPRSLELRKIVGALIRQLLEEINMPDDLEQQLAEFCGRHPGVVADEALSAILFRATTYFSKLWLFIDGLDECRYEVQTAVLSILDDLSRSKRTVMKILVASRDEYAISNAMKKYTHLRIGEENNSSDINYFVENMVKTRIVSGILEIRDISLESEIVTSLTRQAHGMLVTFAYHASISIANLNFLIRFLWVYFQIADLCDADSDYGIRQVLQNLPHGMAETYARAVKKISRKPAKVDRARHIFRRIASAKRPLLLAELAEAVAFSPSDKSWDHTKVPHTSHLIQDCGNLLILDDDGTVRFAHHTVQQFLLGLPPECSISDFHFHSRTADIETGEICITYLSFSDFENQLTIPEPRNAQQASQFPSPYAIIAKVIPGERMWNIVSKFTRFSKYLPCWKSKQPSLTFELDLTQFAELKKPPRPDMSTKFQLLDYAVENWLHHISTITEEDALWNKFKYLATEKSTSFDIRPWDNPNASNHLPYIGLFRWAIRAGHTGLLRLLMQLSDSNLQGYCQQLLDEGFSISTYAALRGYTDMLKLLSKHNGPDPIDSKALIESVRAGDESAVRCILEFGHCNDALTDALQVAMDKMDSAILCVLLENRPPLNLEDGLGAVMLKKAAEQRSTNMLTTLLCKAVDFEAAIRMLGTTWGEKVNILCEFAKLGMHRVFQQVLERVKVDINQKDLEHLKTPLCWASQYGNEAIVNLLLSTGKVNIEPDTRQSPFVLAIKNWHTSIVELLFETGKVDINREDLEYFKTPLCWAAECGNEMVVDMLLDTSQVVIESHRKHSPFSLAIRHGHTSIAELLYQTGRVDVNKEDGYRQRPLSLAVRTGNNAIVQLLLDTGKVDVNAISKNSWRPGFSTPLSLAADAGYLDIVQLLLDTGKVDVNAISKNSWRPGFSTPLSLAADAGHLDVVRLLLSKSGNNIWSKDSDGRTPLLRAAAAGHWDIVQSIFNTVNADIDSRNSSGCTPLSWALEFGHEPIVLELIRMNKLDINSTNINGHTPLSLAARYGRDKVVRQLLKTNQVEIDAKSDNGRTPLSWAVCCGNRTLIKMLLETGKADVNAMDLNGRTPLSLASECGHTDVAKLLLENIKVDVGLKDSMGRTPLLWAVRSYNPDTELIVLLLKTGKADINAMDLFGETPLSLALKCDYTKVIKLLHQALDGRLDDQTINGLSYQLVRELSKGPAGDPDDPYYIPLPLPSLSNLH